MQILNSVDPSKKNTSLTHARLMGLYAAIASLILAPQAYGAETVPAENENQTAHPFLSDSIFKHRDEFALTFMPDGKTLYYSRASLDYSQSDIYMASWHKGFWREARIAPFSSDAVDFDPFISPCASKLYFVSSRCPEDPTRCKGSYDIWVMDREESCWGKPRHLDATVNSPHNDGFLSVASSGNIYFCSDRPEGYGSYDIYVAVRTEDGYLPAKNLGGVINSSNLDTDPLIAPDESFLIYSRGGNLHISMRSSDGWSEPRDLGTLVNTAYGHEFAPGFSPDRHYFYFTRQNAEGRSIHHIRAESLGMPEVSTVENNSKSSIAREDRVVYSRGPWEEEIGYRQAVRTGNMLFISGTVGSGSMEDAVEEVFHTIQDTLSHFGLDFSHVIMERTYTTDIEALKAANHRRLSYYKGNHPAATWVQIDRLFSPEHVLEIEMIAVVSDDK